MICLYSSICKRNFMQNEKAVKSTNPYNNHISERYVNGKVAYDVNSNANKKDFITIENIVYDNHGNFGQFINIDYE